MHRERRIPKYPPGYMGSLETGEAEYTRSGWFFSGVSVTHVWQRLRELQRDSKFD